MDTLAWLTRLIAFDTTSCNSNKALMDCIQAWFAQHNIPVRLTSHPKEPKLNLFATLPAQNGSKEGGIIFSGHTDVVPVTGQKWDSNPFEAVRKEDKIFGRGACDMKGFIAVTLALVPELQKLSLSQPVHFAFSYDEEVGCVGVPLLIADLQQANIKPRACIVGEPTEMHPIVAHKGIQLFRCHIHGLAAHSSLTTQGCNAIEYAARLICYIRELAEEFKQAVFDPHFDVPFTSVSINMIQGGNAANIIPADCEFTFEYRNLPEMDPDTIIAKIAAYVQNELLPSMQREHSSATILIDRVAMVPSFKSADGTMIHELMRAVSGEVETRKVAYATEAGLFQAADIPTIICGPGNIEQAHRANEFVTIEQLKKCEAFLLKVVKGL